MLASVLRRLLHRGILARRRAPPLAPRPRLFSNSHVPQGHPPPVQSIGLGPEVDAARGASELSLDDGVRVFMRADFKYQHMITAFGLAFTGCNVERYMRKQREKKAEDGSTMDALVGLALNME